MSDERNHKTHRIERENVIEWVTGDDTITVTLSQRKYISKVRKLAAKWPSLVSILAENADGSILAHLPLKALKLSITPHRTQFDGSRKEEDGDETKNEDGDETENDAG